MDMDEYAFGDGRNALQEGEEYLQSKANEAIMNRKQNFLQNRKEGMSLAQTRKLLGAMEQDRLRGIAGKSYFSHFHKVDYVNRPQNFINEDLHFLHRHDHDSVQTMHPVFKNEGRGFERQKRDEKIKDKYEPQVGRYRPREELVKKREIAHQIPRPHTQEMRAKERKEELYCQKFHVDDKTIYEIIKGHPSRIGVDRRKRAA